MLTGKWHTLFLDDVLSEELEDPQPTPAPPRPKTHRTLQRQRGMIGQDLLNASDSTTTPEPTTSTQTRFPVKNTSVDSNSFSLIPVLTGSPWSHYKRRYRVKYGYSFGVITSRSISGQTFMIRTIVRHSAEEYIQNICQLGHPNLVENLEIYIGSDASCFLISKFMPTSLLYIRRAPIYPTEPQLASILHQVSIRFNVCQVPIPAHNLKKVLSGLEFLLNCGLVHEQLSCANILVNFAGEVKICDVENCSRSGDTAALSRSFSKITMNLMDKERVKSTVVGLTHPENWSHNAINMFTTITTTPDVKKLLTHAFLQKKDQQELLWLIPFILITASYNRE